MLKILLGIALGLVCAVALCEGALWVLPTQDGIFAADPSTVWPVHHLVPNSSFTYSAGWNFRHVVHGHINNFGYVAPFDYQPGEGAVVVVGDSYIESAMNPYEETLQANIQRAVGPGLAVLNFGVSGAELPDYLGVGALIGRTFKPAWVVIVLTEGDYRGGFPKRPGYFRWTDRPPDLQVLTPEASRGTLTKIVRRVGLVRYVRGNLRMSWRGLFKSDRFGDNDAPACVPATLTSEDKARIDAYSAALSGAYNIAPTNIVLVFDSETRRKAMYTGTPAEACATADSLALARLAANAARDGMRIVDLSPIFERHYRATGIHVDGWPSDDHWNGIGHRLAADAVLHAMSCSSAASRPGDPSHSGQPDCLALAPAE
jgi:hypothetical protein